MVICRVRETVRGLICVRKTQKNIQDNSTGEKHTMSHLFTKEHKYIKVSNRERNYIQCHICSQKNTNTLR